MNLHLKLKEMTGRSALDLIHRIRFDRATKLLDEGRLSISQIADETGFGSSAWFTTSFKKQMGLTPSEYRSRHKEALNIWRNRKETISLQRDSKS